MCYIRVCGAGQHYYIKLPTSDITSRSAIRMKFTIVLTVTCLISCILSDPVPDDLNIQVVQEVQVGGGGCCGGKHEEEEDECAAGPRGLRLWATPPGSLDDVRAACHDKGYSLLAIEDPFLFDDVIHTLREEMPGLYDYWVDGSDDNGDRVWRFSDGSDMPLGSPFWDMEYGRPSLGMMPRCVALQGSRSYYWRDFPCDYFKPGLCACGEVDTPPAPEHVSCPENTTDVFGRCVLILPNLVDDFAEARENCSAEGGDLLRLNNPGIMREFYHFVETSDELWSEIIFVDGELNEQGTFLFSSNSPVPMGSLYWQVGHPTGEANHLHYSTTIYLVNDVPCGTTDPPPPPPTLPPTTTADPFELGPHHHRPMGPFHVACQMPPL
ncbi:uncharacterized protein LOC122255653 [Penaeus japonicus]|uniref:uncharacterized protein LOC122255653 n=1 Tax=Penaeus japonicus TaxID=27405 RepID=UPI001C7137A1|nr:uncharacterized protein LOC122255653 [Penaeus japonicus]